MNRTVYFDSFSLNVNDVVKSQKDIVIDFINLLISRGIYLKLNGTYNWRNLKFDRITGLFDELKGMGIEFYQYGEFKRKRLGSIAEWSWTSDAFYMRVLSMGIGDLRFLNMKTMYEQIRFEAGSRTVVFYEWALSCGGSLYLIKQDYRRGLINSKKTGLLSLKECIDGFINDADVKGLDVKILKSGTIINRAAMFGYDEIFSSFLMSAALSGVKTYPISRPISLKEDQILKWINEQALVSKVDDTPEPISIIDMVTEVNKIKADLDDIKKTVDNVQTSNDISSAVSITSKIDDYTNKIEVLKSQISALSSGAKNSNEVEMINRISQAVSELTSKLIELLKNIENTDESTLKSERDRLFLEKDELERKITELNLKMSYIINEKMTIDSLNSKINELTTTLESMESSRVPKIEMEKITQERDMLKLQIEKLKNEKTVTESTNDDEKIDFLVKSLDNCNNDYKKLSTENSEILKIIENQKIQIESLKNNSGGNDRSEIERLMGIVSQMEKTKNENDLLMTSIEKQKKDLEVEYQKLKNAFDLEAKKTKEQSEANLNEIGKLKEEYEIIKKKYDDNVSQLNNYSGGVNDYDFSLLKLSNAKLKGEKDDLEYKLMVLDSNYKKLVNDSKFEKDVYMTTLNQKDKQIIEMKGVLDKNNWFNNNAGIRLTFPNYFYYYTEIGSNYTASLEILKLALTEVVIGSQLQNYLNSFFDTSFYNGGNKAFRSKLTRSVSEPNKIFYEEYRSLSMRDDSVENKIDAFLKITEEIDNVYNYFVMNLGFKQYLELYPKGGFIQSDFYSSSKDDRVVKLNFELDFDNKLKFYNKKTFFKTVNFNGATSIIDILNSYVNKTVKGGLNQSWKNVINKRYGFENGIEELFINGVVGEWVNVLPYFNALEVYYSSLYSLRRGICYWFRDVMSGSDNIKRMKLSAFQYITAIMSEIDKIVDLKRKADEMKVKMETEKIENDKWNNANKTNTDLTIDVIKTSISNFKNIKFPVVPSGVDYEMLSILMKVDADGCALTTRELNHGNVYTLKAYDYASSRVRPRNDMNFVGYMKSPMNFMFIYNGGTSGFDINNFVVTLFTYLINSRTCLCLIPPDITNTDFKNEFSKTVGERTGRPAGEILVEIASNLPSISKLIKNVSTLFTVLTRYIGFSFISELNYMSCASSVPSPVTEKSRREWGEGMIVYHYLTMAAYIEYFDGKLNIDLLYDKDSIFRSSTIRKMDFAVPYFISNYLTTFKAAYIIPYSDLRYPFLGAGSNDRVSIRDYMIPFHEQLESLCGVEIMTDYSWEFDSSSKIEILVSHVEILRSLISYFIDSGKTKRIEKSDFYITYSDNPIDYFLQACVRATAPFRILKMSWWTNDFSDCDFDQAPYRAITKQHWIEVMQNWEGVAEKDRKKAIESNVLAGLLSYSDKYLKTLQNVLKKATNMTEQLSPLPFLSLSSLLPLLITSNKAVSEDELLKVVSESSFTHLCLFNPLKQPFKSILDYFGDNGMILFDLYVAGSAPFCNGTICDCAARGGVKVMSSKQGNTTKRCVSGTKAYCYIPRIRSNEFVNVLKSYSDVCKQVDEADAMWESQLKTIISTAVGSALSAGLKALL